MMYMLVGPFLGMYHIGPCLPNLKSPMCMIGSKKRVHFALFIKNELFGMRSKCSY